MHTSIEFPNLGIHLENVGKTLTIFQFDIAYYGIVIGLGIVAGLLVAMYVAKRTKQEPENYIDLAMFAVVFGIIGARIYYVVFSWDMYKDHILSIFNIREGGLAIYGGVIAAVITVFVFARVKKLSAPLLLDTAVFGLVTGQMIGRWGNFFNREAFGEYTDNLFAMRLPLDAVRSTSDVTEKMWAHLETIDGVDYIQVHPTYLYESIWCLLVLVLLFIYLRHKVFDGEVFLVYLAGYGIGRFWIEGLRTDQLLLPGIGLPVSQVLAGVLVMVSVILIIVFRRKSGRRQNRTHS
ncbi:prolipoprotein diacylglyceryl transferase [Dorea acetigenes]|jgi:phosphatidylglycerol:prolipoprotein diacylglycerol transferase|uniref:Phosphatidylglycerol--prolipoprotein diacylglyceryl transferase n=1 Tax=Dorea acetigenes TaxID=2981787 RepID=A0ABT2RPD8_9FIRM|nr:prolipoprotein diacylglyceryl transferase [Dorea acetigenes]MCU6687279.1 prolipoprotein diacylglyceryl transferase [Dorea acetigenes]SCJ34514.1 Prolipoprotein diacylglyceryl transferase [uncultured Clostridium sp.]